MDRALGCALQWDTDARKISVLYGNVSVRVWDPSGAGAPDGERHVDYPLSAGDELHFVRGSGHWMAHMVLPRRHALASFGVHMHTRSNTRSLERRPAVAISADHQLLSPY